MKKLLSLFIIMLMLSGCNPNSGQKEISKEECEKMGGIVKSANQCDSFEKNVGRVNNVRCLCDCCIP